MTICLPIRRTAADLITFLIGFGIAAGDEHHAYGGALVSLSRTLVESACCHGLEHLYNVGLQAQHDGLGLRVAHTAVVLNHHWGVRRRILGVDESEEYEALVVDALGGQSFYCWADDAVFHLLHPLLVGKRHWRNRAHAAGIQPCVVFAYPLVVLGLRQYLIVASVGEHKHRALNAAEELLDDHASRSIAELARMPERGCSLRCGVGGHSKHILQLTLGLVERGNDEHSLAGAEAVGLQHIRGLQGFQKRHALLQGVGSEGLVAGGGYAMALHEGLGKVFRPFKNGTGLRRTDDGNGGREGVGLQVVVDALHQWVLGTYHHHFYVFVNTEALDGLLCRRVIVSKNIVIGNSLIVTLVIQRDLHSADNIFIALPGKHLRERRRLIIRCRRRRFGFRGRPWGGRALNQEFLTPRGNSCILIPDEIVVRIEALKRINRDVVQCSGCKDFSLFEIAELFQLCLHLEHSVRLFRVIDGFVF